MNNTNVITCLFQEECLQLEINQDFEGELIWNHKAEEYLVIEKKEEIWIHPRNLLIPSQPLSAGKLYCGKSITNMDFFLFYEALSLDACTYVSYQFPSSGRVQIGRKDCEITYDNAYVSVAHAFFEIEANQLYLSDMNSRNGVYVNQKRCYKQQLYIGDCIYIMGLQIVIGKKCFAINNPNQRVRVKRCTPYRKIPSKANSTSNHIVVHPFHERSSNFELHEIHIQDPPASMQQDKLPFIYMLGPSMTMGVASMSSAFFSIQNALQNRQSLTSILPTLMMSFSMVASTLIWPVFVKRYEARKEHALQVKRKKDYQLYLRKHQREIQYLMKKYTEYLFQRARIDIETCILQPQDLYQQQLLKEKTFPLSIGVGEKELDIPFLHQEHALSLVEDELIEMKEHFMKQRFILQNVPIEVNLFEHSLWYVKGAKQDGEAYAIYLILQLCACYTPSQIQLVLAFEESAENLHQLRFLPHVFDDLQCRYVAHTTQQAQQVSMYIRQCKKPVIIFSFHERLSEAMHILQLCEDSNVAAVLVHKNTPYVNFPHKTLYMKTSDTVQVDDETSQIQWKRVANVEKACEVLANIKIQSFNELRFPTMYSFLQMYHVGRVEQLHIYTRWQQSDSSRSLAVAIGVNAANEYVLFDAHEKAHGPHGIIAGMTGSGKSELLITMILSMAINFHPDDVSFILIDYKGGGMAKALEDIPHIAGIITNLDGNMIQRSLHSLDSELLRRQNIFVNAAKDLQLPSIDIYAYQKLYHQKVVHLALPHLFIIADEFAELKQQQPEFMEQLIRSARIGRSLGIHLLLATQKPSGVVDDQIWSNARFHICLKVQEKADSMDMLKRDDGAKLSDTGRFYLQVGYNELFEEGQSAYAKMKYIENHIQKESCPIEQIDTLGNVIAKVHTKASTDHYPTELQIIVHALQEVASMHHITSHQLWMPPLPEHIEYSETKENMIALVDDPLRQRQFPIYITLSTVTNVVMFAMDLMEPLYIYKAICYHICRKNSIEDVRILFFDFASANFQECEQVAHVYAYVRSDDEEDIQYLKEYLKQELIERKLQPKHQKIMLCIHHIVSFLEIYEDWESLLYILARDGEQYGIYLLISATSASDVRFRLLQQFTQMFAFSIRDESEYASIFSKNLHALHNKGRAYYKDKEIYEVQCVDITKQLEQYIETQSKTTHAKLIKLPQHVSIQMLAPYYDEEVCNIPIGIQKDLRIPYMISFDFIWILSGSSIHKMLQTLQNCYYTKEIECVHINKFHEEDMAQYVNKKVFLIMEPSLLCEYVCATWIQKNFTYVNVVWIGSGIEQIRYVFNIPMNYQDMLAQDAYIINEKIIPLRMMENI